MAKKNAKKSKNVLSTILVLLFVALLGNHIYYQVTKNAEPAEEAGYVLKFEGGPIDELDVSEVYEEGMTWGELWNASFAARDGKDYYITSTRTFTLVEYNGEYTNGNDPNNYFIILLDGEYIDSASVVDFSITYTLTPMEY